MSATLSAPSTIEAFLEQEEAKQLLRFTTAGSVDDGKSTLIGRLLYDSKGVYEDQIASVKKAADELGKLTAPDKAQAGQDELEQVLREIADGVQPSIEAAKAGNRAKFTATFKAYQAKLDGDFRQRLTAAGSKIDQALAGQ